MHQHYRAFQRATVARSALDIIALIFLMAGFAFWAVAFWQLLSPPALLSLLSIQAAMVDIRAGDVGFTGASHRAPSQVVWHPWADDPNAGPLGDYEIRWQLRDIQGNGWNIVAAFQVVPEPSALVLAYMGAVGVWVAGRRKER